MNENAQSQSVVLDSQDFDKILDDLGKQTFISSDIDFVREKKATEAEIRLEGLSDYFRMRKHWSILLAIALFVILFFNIGLVYYAGTGRIHFEDEWFLRLVLTTNLADIIGLVYVVVHFLFPPTGNLDHKENSKE